jgi:hypothetical protein
MMGKNVAYEAEKVDKLKHLLNNYKEKGKPKPYEIFIDALKVVDKTEDPAEFDGYLDFMDDDAKELRILIYNSNASPRNDKHIFDLKPKETERRSEEKGETLSGTEIDQRISNSLEAERKKWELQQLQQDYEKTKGELKEAEEYIEKLETALQEEKTNKFKLGKINVGELASVALEGFIRRNPKMLSKLPGGEALAGVIEEDNMEKRKAIEEPEPETRTTFKKKETAMPQLSPEEIEGLAVIKMMRENFSQEQLKEVWDIIGQMAQDTGLIVTISDLLAPPEKVTSEEKEESEEVTEVEQLTDEFNEQGTD